MNKNKKLFFVGSDFYHSNTTRKLFLSNNYEIEFYSPTEHYKLENTYFDLVLFDLNSLINIEDLIETSNIVNQESIIFVYSKDTPEKEIQKTKGINSFGYLPYDVNDSVFNITINNALEYLNQKQADFKISAKFKELNNIYELLLQISALYLEKSLQDDSEKVQESLELIGLFVEADRSYIFLYDWDSETCSNTHEWCGPSVSPEIVNLQNIPINLIPDWVDTHRKGKPLIIENVQALDEDSELKKILEPQSIKSLITVPIFDKTKCYGFVGFDYVYNYSDISEKEFEVLTLYSKILNSLETRKRFEKELLNTNNELETKVKLTNEELLIKEKKHSIVLQQHISDLEEILFTISHKFRQPVTQIIGFSKLLDMSNSDINEINEIVNYIKLSTESLDALTHELFRLTREHKERKLQ